MKKAILIFSALILAFIALVVVFLTNLSSIASYATGKLIKGEAHISSAALAYKAGNIILDFKNIRLKGSIEGQAENWQLVISLKKGLCLDQVTVSDFELSVPEAKGKPRLFLLPQELFEISRGIITYNKRRFIVDEVKIRDLKAKKPFTFEIGIRNDSIFGAIRASGEGTYRGSASDIKGRLSVASLNLNQFSQNMSGMVNSEGTFTYAQQKFIYDGPFEIFDYMLKDAIFRKPFTVRKSKGKVSFLSTGALMNINIGNADYKDTSLALNLTFKKNSLARLELGSGFIDIREVKDNIALERIAKSKYDIMNYITSGNIKIRKFVFEKAMPLYGEVELKDTSISFKDTHFNNVEAVFSFDEKRLNVREAKGIFRTSTFYNVTGVIPFSEEKDINARGSYSFNLKDIPSFLNVGEIDFKNGETEGTIGIEWNKDRGYKVDGAGKILNSDITWKKLAVSAKGAYTFNNDEIVFDPLIINKGGTDLVIKGRWNKKFMDIKLKGDLDVIHIMPFAAVPFNISGVTNLDMEIYKDSNEMKADGDILMNDIYFEIPGIIKKDRGIKSKATLTVLKGAKQIRIERLLYDLDIINLNLKGDMQTDKKMNLDIAMNIPSIEKIARLFFFDGNSTKGDLELNLSIRDLMLPIKKLPYINGYAKINNGFLRLPWIRKTLKEIDIVSKFKGEAFDIEMSRLKCGTSVLNEGKLHSEGLESPRFTVHVNMETLDLNDFKTPGESSIRPINEKSLMAKVSGEMSLRSKKVNIGNVNGEYLDMKGLLSDRKFNISELKMNLFDGNIDVLGSIDLSGSIPLIYAGGRLNRIRSGMFMKAFGAKTYIAEGRSNIYGHVDSKGSTMTELVGDINGDVAIYSRNGRILKWNILSKIFGLLNIYDSLRGKAELSKEGLPYTRMGATFTAKNGIFSTKDFLIDSPSMVITGNGILDIKKDTIDGNIAVSPLVTLDRTIDKVPILRNILKEKEKGFLYAAYKVKGPIDDPDVSVSFVNTIGGKAIGILKNILILPKELLEGN